MRIDYCPKCGKAGLKREDSKGKGPDGLTSHERWLANNNQVIDSRDMFSGKWCPRCQEWVKPVNRPYVGVSGRG